MLNLLNASSKMLHAHITHTLRLQILCNECKLRVCVEFSPPPKIALINMSKRIYTFLRLSQEKYPSQLPGKKPYELKIKIVASCINLCNWDYCGALEF